MKQQTVILAITYDDTQEDPPSQWDWPVVLEVQPHHVEVLLTGVLLKAGETR